MLRLRNYPAAADLFEAGASGENTSQAVAFAAILRKARHREDVHYDNDPAGVAMQFTGTGLEQDLTIDKMKSFLSRNAQKVVKGSEKDELDEAMKAGRSVRAMMSRSGLPPDSMLDVVMQIIEPKVEGTDATGYKVTLRIAGTKNQILYVIKEDGKYKILDTSAKPNAVALEILDRLNADDLAGARVLLDWLREEEHLAGGDDPLAGTAFPRFWTKGKEGDADQIKLAAAAILVETKPTAQQGVSMIAAAKDTAKSDADKLNLSLALLAGYFYMEDYEKLLAVAAELAKQYPESRRAFLEQSIALRALGRYAEADQLAAERLKKMTDDLDALRALVSNASAREDYALSHERGLKLVAAGKAEPADLNELAWHALFTSSVSNDDVENAIKAAQLSTTKTAELHTLGCVYAEIGKIKEAREVLVQSMDLLALDEPDSNYWYAFGRIAEQYGEQKTAMADYAHVTKPEKAIAIPSSSYRLAQNRLKILDSGSAAGISAARK
jgi:tetratricopeptide (TPR) repeat protein